MVVSGLKIVNAQEARGAGPFRSIAKHYMARFAEPGKGKIVLQRYNGSSMKRAPVLQQKAKCRCK